MNLFEPGTYTKTYTATTNGIEETVEVDFLVLSEYYGDAAGLYGDDLLVALRTILNDTVDMGTYADAIDILPESDRDPDNPDNMILVYTNRSVDHTWDSGTTWNREHVWPQSLLDISTNSGSSHVGADLHNLKPADPSENGSRGSKFFDDFASTSSYEPRDAVKGDLARILFYMVIMYDYLELVSQTPQTHQMAMLDVLIRWHEDDPVDAFETNRNDVIFGYQNNRNPFIDYPSFYDMIYEQHEVIMNA